MGIVVKRNGDVIVTEYENHRIKIFSQESLGESTTIGVVGVGAGKFACPRGIALDDNDNILVADSQNHRIQVVSSTGEPLGTFGMIGSDPGCLDTPHDVSMDTNGNIIVADTKNHRLQVFTRLVPVYAEPVMYDEEYEAAVEIEHEEGLKENEDEITANNFDKKTQPNNQDVVVKDKTGKSPNTADEQENNDRNIKETTDAEEGKTTGTVKSEILQQSKQSFNENQEIDVNNNTAKSVST